MSKQLTVQELADQIQREFLAGKGRITQLPGAAAPETRKFYKYHKGYDYGLPEGSPITPSFAGEATDLGVVPGYGRRVLVKNPQTGQSYYVSHLSGVNFNTPNFKFQAGTPIALTGGVPGKYGAGSSTGAHVDIELANGAIPSYQNLINGKRTANRTFSINDLLSKVKQKYGNKISAVSMNKDKLQAVANKTGAKLVRITV